MAPASIDLDQRSATRTCQVCWLLACIIWILVAGVPLRQPDRTALEAATAYAGTLRIAIPDGHRIIYTWWPETVVVCAVGFGLLRWPRTRPAQTAWVRRVRGIRHRHAALLILLACAFVARAALAYAGGQYFDWDESRYGVGATTVLLALSQADWDGTLTALCRLPSEHTGFRILGLLPALAQTVPAWLHGTSLIEMQKPAGEWVAAAALSAFSVLVIAQVYWLALKLGAERREALFATILTACSTTLFMYSRHFFPYDASLALALAGLGIGLRERRPGRSLVSGVLAGFAFLVYNGYWLLVPLVGVTQAVYARRSFREVLTRLVLFGVGAAALPALLLWGAQATSGKGWDDAVRFAGTAINGDFAAGWRVPWQFLWQAEHGLLVLWGLGAALLILPAARTTIDRTLLRRGRFWLMLAALFYLGLVVAATGLHKFVVYDRSVHPMVPLLCLATASACAGVFRESRRARWQTAIIVLAIGQAVWHTVPLFALQFPREVRWWASQRYGEEIGDGGQSYLLSVNAPGVTSPDSHRLVLVNGRDVWLDGTRLPAPREIRGKVVYRTRHPRQLDIYQYHGYTEQIRAAVRRIDLSIRVVDRQER